MPFKESNKSFAFVKGETNKIQDLQDNVAELVADEY